MEIMDNGVVRDMTEEEEKAFKDASIESEADVLDYENALSDMGVRFGD